MRLPLLALLLLAAAAPAAAQNPAPDTMVYRIPAPRGEAVVVGTRAKAVYDEWRYAPVRVADNVAYVSGVVAGPLGPEPADSAVFRRSVEGAFRHIQRTLRAVGADLDDVVMLNTFHVFESPHFQGDKRAHIDAFRRAKDATMTGPAAPAWTAIGVSGLFPDRGLVEIQVIAHIGPPPAAR
jgi:enamine deaminase RidA (YjgF/YER057c/UK114 family)